MASRSASKAGAVAAEADTEARIDASQARCTPALAADARARRPAARAPKPGLPMLAAVALALAGLAGLPALAAPTAPAVRGEIDALLARLQRSGCQFNRNGTWHDAADVRGHLLRKLAAVEDATTLRSTEQFIDAAASFSSMTQQPYLVRCGSAAPVPSRDWLLLQLQALRAAPPLKAP